MPDSTELTASAESGAVSRQELYDLAWETPMLRIAERFGVSSSYLARVFTELRVPRPAPGYWAQREFGNAPPKPPLPSLRPGDLTAWTPGASLGTTVRSIVRAAKAAEVDAAETGAKATAARPLASRAMRTRSAPASRHELLIGVKSLFLRTRKVEVGILRPYKRLLVDVMSSEAKLDDALDAAQALFGALHRKGFHVGFAQADHLMRRVDILFSEKLATKIYHYAPWAPERPTVVHIGGVAIGLTLFEMTEEVEVVYVNGEYLPVRSLSDKQVKRLSGPLHWRTQRECASGRLCVQAYCPYRDVDWSKRWQESKPGTFGAMVAQIVNDLEVVAPVLARQVREAKLRAEEEHRRWEVEQRRREAEWERLRQEKARQDSKRDLLEAIASWDEARRVRDFFVVVESVAKALAAGDAAVLHDRVRLGRELVEELDPVGQLMRWKAPTER